MLGDLFKLGVNNLRRRRLRSWLTMLGIFIGIAAVVALISLGQGLQTAVTAQFASLSTDKLTIQNAGTGLGPPGSTVIEKLNEHDVKVIERVSGVEYVISRLLRNGKVEFNGNLKFKYLGSLPEDEKQAELVYEAMALEVEKGRLLKPTDSGKIVLGNSVPKKEEFDKEIEVGNKILIQEEEFEVVGIFEKASTFTLNDAILITEDDMKELLNIGDEIDTIIAQVKDSKDIEQVAERIERVMRRDRSLNKGEEDFSVQTPLEALSTVNTILISVNAVVIGIAMISLIVGGIGIANTMYTSVIERKKEIGTMKAVGAKNSDILTVFLIESGLLGVVGGIVGVLIGSGIALLTANLANNFFGNDIILVNISLPLIISSVAFSFLIGVLSGAIPSYQASKLRPVEALRG